MKKVIFAGLSLMSLFLLIACGEKETKQTSSPKQPAVQQIAVGKDAPDFTLQSMDGKEVKLSDYKGKKVYLKFWASWCGPCKKSMPELMELAAKQDRDFEILSVIAPGLQGEKTVQDFPKWYKEQGYKDIPVLYDTQATTFQAYQIRSIPTEYLIDSQGKIGKIQFGAISNADAEAAFKEMNKRKNRDCSRFFIVFH
ncbi:thioredoxin family protein [Streptococcus oralis Uo5]|uniref:Thioredoxin family protein n=1 Tax=Streptococcus oralis (strain Uo5) TaxID=927666 RepID=F2QDT1_STROU|nr:thiol-disulfide oxidoreductase-associated lipoprotein SdbB [Streptococcus oralis]CBZ00800.1 thioredoxin family protein [Streptococcus oralis Uo5]